MLIESIMIRNVASISHEVSLLDAAKMMKEKNVGALVVTDSGQVKGVITDRDILVRFASEGHELSHGKVADHMSSPVIAVTPDTDAFEAARTMRNHGIQRLPVERAGNLVGIVSMGDIARAMDKPLHDLVLGNWKHSAEQVAIAART